MKADTAFKKEIMPFCLSFGFCYPSYGKNIDYDFLIGGFLVFVNSSFSYLEYKSSLQKDLTIHYARTFSENIVEYLEKKLNCIIEKDAKEFLERLPYKIDLLNFISRIHLLIKNSKIITTIEDDEQVNLLLIVCFKDEDFKTVDDIMNKIYDILFDSKISYITVVESFSCHSAGHTS